MTQANGICLKCLNVKLSRRRITCKVGLLQTINREKCHKVVRKEVRRENKMEWQCLKCSYRRKGKEDGFKLLSKGVVQCPQCGTKHFISPITDELMVMQDNSLFDTNSAQEIERLKENK